MVAVGIRELKTHLSQYVKRLEIDGERIAVTDRGRIVGYLTPANADLHTAPRIAPRARPTLRERIRARGGESATADFASSSATLPPLATLEFAGDVQALLQELRGGA